MAFKMKGFPKRKGYLDDKQNPEGNTEISESDGRTMNEVNATVAKERKLLTDDPSTTPAQLKAFDDYHAKRKQEIHGQG